MKINPDLIPAGLHIIGAVDTRMVDQEPSAPRRARSTVILSSVGEIFLYHPNQIVDALFPICNISEIHEIEYKEREVHHPWKLRFWKFNLSLAVFYGLILTIFGFLFLFETMLYGHGDVDIGGFSNDPVSSGSFSQSILSALASIILIYTIGSPIVFSLLLESFVPTYVTPRHITLRFEDDKVHQLSEKPEWRGVYSLAHRFWLLGTILIMISYLPPMAIVEFLLAFILGAFVFSFVYLGFTRLTSEQTESEIGELRTGNLLRFRRLLDDLHSKSFVEGEKSAISSNQHEITTVQDRVAGRIKEPLERLYTHQDVLNSLTDGEWEAMLTATKIYFSLAQIRRCTEKMLYKLTEDIGIKIKSQNRGITTMLQRLNQHEALPSNAIKWVEVIKAIANPAAHDMVEDMDDFVSAFKAFVSLTNWYVDHLSSEDE